MILWHLESRSQVKLTINGGQFVALEMILWHPKAWQVEYALHFGVQHVFLMIDGKWVVWGSKRFEYIQKDSNYLALLDGKDF